MLFPLSETAAILMIIGALIFVGLISIGRDLRRKKSTKTVTEAEARQIDLEKKGKVLKFLGEDKVLVEMFPVSKPGAASPNAEDIVTSIDVKAKNKIPFEITRVKKKKRVVIRRGTFNRGDMWVRHKMRGETIPRAYYTDLRQLAWVPYRKGYRQELIFDAFFCEPLSAKEDTPVWSQDVEDMRVDSKLDQEIEVGRGPQPFKITRTLSIAMIVTALLLTFFGLSLNAIFHFIPNVLVHWVPG